jgi:ABC-type ATPase involved in cell division
VVIGAPPSSRHSWQTGLARKQVPQRDVDAGHRLRDRTDLAGLQHQHLELLRQLVEALLGPFQRAPHQAVGEVVDQARAVLGPHRRPVAPDLAPTLRTVGVGQRTSTIGRSRKVPNETLIGFWIGTR